MWVAIIIENIKDTKALLDSQHSIYMIMGMVSMIHKGLQSNLDNFIVLSSL